MRNLTLVACLFGAGVCTDAIADGLICQLPEDGAWARFKVTGGAVGADGTVRITVEGSQTVRSVGETSIENRTYRWIEVESDITLHRAGKPEVLKELIKILVSEADLEKGNDPLAHVVKAYKGESGEALGELDLTGEGARQVQSMDELSPICVVVVRWSPCGCSKTCLPHGGHGCQRRGEIVTPLLNGYDEVVVEPFSRSPLRYSR
jgi:hypothetical protein